MATLAAPRREQELRSGGKMVRARRTTLTRTPYDRPRLDISGEQNPNWISRLIYSPSRMIASNAGKLLSSVFRSESSDSSSSCSSSSGSDAASDDIDDNENDNYVSSPGAQNFEKGEPQRAQTISGTSETKRLIEQLLMQETFSREECDRLTNIIKSRVVNSSLIGVMNNESPSRSADNVVDTAVMEARKWLEEKKSGSSSKSDLCHKTCTLNCAILPLGSEGEGGSPVDMAKSYMRTRPPWASPSVNLIEHGSPSPIQIHIFKEGTPYSIAENLVSSSKLKRDSPTTSSWNIREELQKVRSKATEEMLRTRPSSKIDWSSSALEHKSSHALMFNNRLGGATEHDIPRSTKSLAASLNLAAGSVSEMTQELLLNDGLPNPTTLNCEQNEGTEVFQGIKRTGDEALDMVQRLKSPEDIKTITHSDAGAAADIDQLKETNETTQQLNSTIRETIQASRTPDKNCSTSEPAVEVGGGGFTANGSRSSELREQDDRPRDEEANAGGPGPDKNVTAPVGETCELLSEASVEVPIVDENGSVATGSLNSSSMHHEDSSQNQSRPNSKRRKKNNGVDTLPGMKRSRSTRSGRGRSR